jgi:glycine oxidase
MNIGIVGAGIMGRVLAWQLLREGHQISVFDRDSKVIGRAASYTAAGMLAPYSELESSELLIFRMGQRGLQLWPELVRSLQVEGCFYQRGSLVVAHHQDRVELQRFNYLLQDKLAETGQQLCRLDQRQLAKLEPALAPRFSEATVLADECWLNNEAILTALAKQLMQQGVRWHSNTKVKQLSGGCIATEDKHYQFDWVIDCRGLGARSDIKGLRGVRGELIWVHAPEVEISRMVRLMHPRYRLYLVPQSNSRYIVGATQIESDDASPISVRSTLELLSALYSIDGGFSEARILASKTNCRPALLDNQPLITAADGLIRVNGLFRHGYMLAPLLAAEVGRYLTAKNTGSLEFPEIFQPLNGVNKAALTC